MASIEVDLTNRKEVEQAIAGLQCVLQSFLEIKTDVKLRDGITPRYDFEHQQWSNGCYFLSPKAAKEFMGNEWRDFTAVWSNGGYLLSPVKGLIITSEFLMDRPRFCVGSAITEEEWAGYSESYDKIMNMDLDAIRKRVEFVAQERPYERWDEE